MRWLIRALGILVIASALGCSKSSSSTQSGITLSATAEGCMTCHNGSNHDDYGGRGLENPHPFPGAGSLQCTQCHGGNPRGATVGTAHVPPPPEIGDEKFQEQNAHAYFNRLTLTGIDKFPDYTVKGQTWKALDYLQFVNPGDLRVVKKGRSCGECHMPHVDCVVKSPLATETGILSGAMYAAGVDLQVAATRGLYQETGSDLGFRQVSDPDYVQDPDNVGAVPKLKEFPVYSVLGEEGGDNIYRNDAYAAADLGRFLQQNGQAVTGSPLANLWHEQVAFTCGDCHLGSAGANNRYGDFRSSGCTACHMRYALDGRSTSTDRNIKKNEPADPDDIDEPERPHVKRHLITSVARTLATGETVQGIDDYTCAGCHQGSNRTVMQFWGIRLDQNQDVVRRTQYPAQPASFRTTRDDTRLFDPVVENRTFNGRNHNQYLLEEDYDGDGRDDTPPDVHYEAGMGCIDCHGSHDLHGGTVGDPSKQPLVSRQEQAVAIRCESCHGDVDAYAATVAGMTYDGTPAQVAVDSEGNPLRHVAVDSDGHLYLTSRLTGNRHYVSQTRDVVVDSGVLDPFTDEPVYSVLASYAMGRADGDPNTGLGPLQTDHPVVPGFSHGDTMSCTACHSSWTNSCIGCHLEGEYDTGNNFSNITGQRIVFEEDNADFVYQSPVFFQLGVDTHGKIAPMAANSDFFFSYTDKDNVRSDVYSFSDRNAQGSNELATAFPAMSHNAMMPHSIRGKIHPRMEGPRYCVSCHLTDRGLKKYGTEYADFRANMAGNLFGNLDYDLLQVHFGENTGNQMNSPLWVHMVAGLGSGLFLFNEDGGPVNPLDFNANRVGAGGIAPATNFNPLDAFYNLDKIVDDLGVSAASNNHVMLDLNLAPQLGPGLRVGATYPNLSGPLGSVLIQKLTDPNAGIVLDSWLNADANPRGDAKVHLGQ